MDGGTDGYLRLTVCLEHLTVLITQSLLLTEFESGIQMDLFHVSFVYSILDNLYCLYHIRVQNNLDMFDNRTLNFLVLY